MEQTLVFMILGISLSLFIWGKPRYDVVALLALFALAIFGVIPAQNAFRGFSHPAVITVAAVLVISKALDDSGLIDLILRLISKAGKQFFVQILVLCTIVTVASAFINNIGALAIMMPVAVQMARKNEYPPSQILMPVAFASILGGMATLIGTPPNIIIATFSTEYDGATFSFFDFTPVGGTLAIIGLAFIVLLGWRFLPRRQAAESPEKFEIENYITEVTVTKDSSLKEKMIGEINKEGNADVLLLGLVRNGRLSYAPSPSERFNSGDVLILETDSENLKSFISQTGVKMAGKGKEIKEFEGAGDIRIIEAVVMTDSPMIGRTVIDFDLRRNFRINLLAISRRERKIRHRIGNISIKVGDVLLLQGKNENLKDAISTMQCLPLAERDFTIGDPRKIILALSIFIASIVLVVLEKLPVQIAFSIAAVVLVMTNILPIRKAYSSIDWPIIILIAALIPIGDAFESSGGARLITNQILGLDQGFPVWVVLMIVMVITICLSNVINNAAAVVLMAPIAINVARGFEASTDPFLMAVAIGASCAFMTPIGHQSNTLVMSPGGYKFSDYWKMGLPLTILLIAIGVPLILYFWPV